MKDIIVQKYGGTSVGSIDRIKRIAQKVVKLKDSGKKVVVTVSAMAKTTDDLMNKARQINENPPERELDMLLSTGEQISIALLAMAIESLGEKVISLTGGQCGIITDSNHKKARITEIDTERIEEELSQDKIVIVAGFQGINENNDITTLGRGGSDTTAVAVAAALKAEKCEIYTDVDGVYTADPRVVKNAKLLDKISYDEMLELASLGAKVLHGRSVEMARKYKIPLVVKSSFNDSKGTEIVEVSEMEKVQVRGVSLDKNIAKLSVLEVPDRPGVAFKLFSELSKNHIPVDMIIQNINRDLVNDISFTVKIDDLSKALVICKEIANEVGASKVLSDSKVCKLSVVGTGIAGSAEVASTFFETLYESGINIQMISTSEIKISCIIDEKFGEDGLCHLHDKFNFDSDFEREVC
ncbi:aspartate kinase [Anaeromicrobium sediminis]|uniref:Aspartokinase n=1 Tax=Anaeromicrobium sediminis TaxID=1478221 RepID=A0A267M9B2_9FIRM|nr:aspartate kinase [Anaeromicrobium sediminis]PAB56164.1 aspartate kinase [Anaeromicrobium sediminis]